MDKIITSEKINTRKTSGYQRSQFNEQQAKFNEKYYGEQIQKQSPRGMPLKTDLLAQKRKTEKFGHHQSSPRQSILNQNNRGLVGSQILKKKNTNDQIVDEAYHNAPLMPRVNTLAKVKIKVKNQATQESFLNETSANQSTSYGGFPSPREHSGKRTVSLQHNLSKGADGRTRVDRIRSSKRNDSIKHHMSIQKPAFRSLNKGGSKAMKKAIDNSNVQMQHVQVPLHIFSTNQVPLINRKNFKEDEGVPYASNYNIFEQNRFGNLFDSQQTSQEISLNTLAQVEDSKYGSRQLPTQLGHNQQLFTQQHSRKDIEINGEEHPNTGLQYMMAPPISQMGTNQSLFVEQPHQLQASMSWNMTSQNVPPIQPIDLNRQALQDTLSKQIGSQTFAKKHTLQIPNQIGEGSNEYLATGIVEDEQESQLQQEFNTTGKSIFDQTTLQEMPSVNQKTRNVLPPTAPKQDSQFTDNTVLDPHILPPAINPNQMAANQNQGIGFVNYVNGVPVSIQLNKNDLFNIGKFPKTQKHLTSKTRNVTQNQSLRIKSDLDKRLHAYNNNLYLQKQINQNLVELQANQGQYLPIIDTSGKIQSKPFIPTNVKPDFFKSKRKQNLTMLRGIYDDGFHGFKQSSNNENDSTYHLPDQLRNSIETPEIDTLTGLTLKDQAASFSLKRSKKKKKEFYTNDSLSYKKSQKYNNLDELIEYQKKSKYGSRHPSKSPMMESNRSRSSSKPPGYQINPKEIPMKLQTAKAGSRQQHYPALTKQIGTSQALKRNHHIGKNVSKSQLRTTQHGGQGSNRKSSLKNLGGATDLDNTDIYGAHPISLDLNRTSGYRPSDFGMRKDSYSPMRNNKGAHSKIGTRDHRMSPIMVRGSKTPEKELWPGVNQHRSFNKVAIEPSLFKMKVPREDMEHLMRDDLDEMSKMEVIYKILKNQLRQHQRTLIKLKEQEKKRKQKEKEMREASPEKGFGDDDEVVDLKEFAKYIRPFEWYGPQRDLSPELKRIVKNLTCQEHSYVYCPSCKQYDEVEHDPMANIKKFMKFIRQEQQRMEDPFKKPVKKKKKVPKEKPLPDDSVSDITDLAEDEILAKYLKKTRTNKQKEAKELQKRRDSAQFRLAGGQITNRHICKDHLPMTEEQKQMHALDDTVVLELRKPEPQVPMMDEDQSAHQFSVKEQSIQADSEERLDIEMRANRLEDKQQRKASMRSPSKGSPDRLDPNVRGSFDMTSQGSRRGRSITEVKSKGSPRKNMGTGMSPVRSINLSPKKQSPLKGNGKLRDEFTLFKPKSQKSEIAIQTDHGGPPRESKKGIRFQDQEESSENEYDDLQIGKQKTVDKYKEDWADSIVYKKAMKAEAIKRGLPYEEYEVVDDEEAFELQTNMDLNEVEDNAQDAQEATHRHEIGFMKKFNEKGNIQMLKESEVTYLKTLLKTDSEKWEFKSTLADIYRHSKFTIRMLTRKMAMIDNKYIFRKNRAANRGNTLTMIYRAELLYAAKGDANKIFQNLAKYIFDYAQFDQISKKMDQLTAEEEKFLRQRDLLVKRLLSQINNFLSQYKIFNNQFMFKQINIHDYLSSELDKVKTCNEQNESIKNMEILHMSDEVSKQKKQIVNPNKIRHTSPYNKEVYKIEASQKSVLSAKVSDQLTAKIGDLMKSARAKRDGEKTFSISIQSKIASAKHIVESDSQSLQKNQSIKPPSAH